MAEKILNTRIQLKYDSLAAWSTANTLLKSGEVAIAYLPPKETGDAPGAVSEAVLIKVGPGNFNSLPFLSALAADVYGWAKAADVVFENQHIIFKDAAGTALKDLDLSTFVSADELSTALSSYYTKTEIDNLFGGVVNTVTTLAEGTAIDITDNGTDGNHAYTVGLNAEEAKTALGLASAAYVTVESLNETAKGYADANAEAIEDHEAFAAQTYETKTDAAQKLADAKAYTDEQIAAIPNPSWNDLTDKPFYDEGIAPITWDGVSDGHEVGTFTGTDGNALSFVKIYNQALTADQLNGAILTLSNGSSMEIPAQAITQVTDKSVVVGEVTLISTSETNFIYEDATIQLPSAGVYVAENSNGTYVSKLTLSGNAIKTLDDKFISENIARVTDVEAAQAAAEAKAAELDAALKTELEGKIDTKLDANGWRNSNGELISSLSYEGIGTVTASLEAKGIVTSLREPDNSRTAVGLCTVDFGGENVIHEANKGLTIFEMSDSSLDKATVYGSGNIRYATSLDTTNVIALPEKSGTIALTSDVEAAQGAVDAIEAIIETYGDIVTRDASEFATATQGAKADAAAVKTEVDAALALKADKSVVGAMYTNVQIDGFLAGKQDVIPANTYDAYGSAAQALADAKAYADENDANFTYSINYDAANKKIQLVGANGGATTDIDATDFIKDGMIDSVAISEDGKNLVITWNTDAGKEATTIALSELADIYTGVDGTTIAVAVSSDDKISAEVKAGSLTTSHIAANAGIVKTQLAADVQASLGKADSALQAHQDISHLATKAALEDVVDGTTPVAKAADADKLGGQLPSYYATAQSVTDITKDGGVIDTKIANKAADFTYTAGSNITIENNVVSLKNELTNVNKIAGEEMMGLELSGALGSGTPGVVIKDDYSGGYIGVGQTLEINGTPIHAIATSGNVNDLVQTAGDVLVFNCGSATTVI